MADYLSKEIAIERIKRVKPHCVMSEYGVGYERGLKDAIGLLNATPAADVQPVRCGRWIISNLYAQCSECSVAYDLDTFQRLIPMNENAPRHCSYCGADMRGGTENGKT